jgi:hypothetical protein
VGGANGQHESRLVEPTNQEPFKASSQELLLCGRVLEECEKIVYKDEGPGLRSG